MEILPNDGEATQGRTGADPAIAREISGRLSSTEGSKAPRPDDDKTPKESAAEKRTASDEKRKRDVNLAKEARAVLARFGIADRIRRR